MTIYLYKKTHRITGLKYLGKTTAKDPHMYTGSGKYWKSHLNKHGFDYDTEILKECATNEEIKQWGEYYSTLWNVVESNDWANLKMESGDGGDPGPIGRSKIAQAQTGRKHTPEENKNKSKRQTGIKRSPEYLAKKLGLKYNKPKARTKSNKNKGRPLPQEWIDNSAKSRTGMKYKIVECPYCGKQGGSCTMPRWHFDNCKFKT
jgi:hypothetical protein